MKRPTAAVLPATALLSSVLIGCAHHPAPASTPAASASRPPRTARFTVKNEFKLKIPAGTAKARVWIPLPQADAQSELADLTAATVTDLKVDAAYPVQLGHDSEGNAIAYLEADNPPPGELVVSETFALARREIFGGRLDPARTRPLSAGELARYQRYLGPSTHVPVGGAMAALAASVVGAEDNPLRRARRLYDWVLDHVDYWVKDPAHKKASPTGDAQFCIATGAGNCSDFHSLFSALARSSGIPTRMVYGGLLKHEIAGLPVDASYHCWVEVMLPGIGWTPLDASVADLYHGDHLSPDLSPDDQKRVRLTAGSNFQGPNEAAVDYYFGHLDERRVVWTTERDLTLSPPQAGPPVNTMVKGYFELDGKVAKEWSWEASALSRTSTYQEIDAPFGPEWPVR